MASLPLIAERGSRSNSLSPHLGLIARLRSFEQHPPRQGEMMRKWSPPMPILWSAGDTVTPQALRC